MTCFYFQGLVRSAPNDVVLVKRDRVVLRKEVAYSSY
jgi:hypothetical protein